MPPKKELTPHQVSSGLSYVHKEPAFLARLKGKSKEKEIASRKFQNYEDGQDDDDYDELEGAQVVELDKNGKEIHKDDGLPSDEEKEEKVESKTEEDQPAVDENGRILFRKQKKKEIVSSNASKRKLNEIIDEELKKTTKEVKKKKSTKKDKKVSLLSFDDEE